MSAKPKIATLSKTEILQHNTRIDVKIVRSHVKLGNELGRLGVKIKPEFKVEPPLARGTARLCSQNF